ncbi:immunity repressor [Mycobacterium phage JF4]|nr:immunity repressor [Mycobacterium phage JF4]QJD52296.1 immunity repressor [Mycobacterium phage JF2]
MNTERPRGKKSDLSLAIIEDLRGKGYTQSEIARMYGVTRQYVSWIKHYYGGKLTPRELVLQHFPFQVPVHQHAGGVSVPEAPRARRVHGDRWRRDGRTEAVEASRFLQEAEGPRPGVRPEHPAYRRREPPGWLGLPAQEAGGRRPVDPGQRLHGPDRRGEDDMEVPAEGAVKGSIREHPQ